jgi:hypothetical protein
MSDEVWISSLDAVRRVRDAGFTEGDLAQWAEAGLLRARAGRGRFSDDEVDHLRHFGNDAGSVLTGPWPNILPDFWHWLNVGPKNREANWGAGVFATTVFDDTELGPNTYSQHIRLYDVVFSATDIDARLHLADRPFVKGMLPSNPTKNARLYEERAHAAARLVKIEGKMRAEAFREVVEPGGTSLGSNEDGRQRALRKTYDLMYDAYGNPVKKYPN